MYNSIFCFTSIGGHIDASINKHSDSYAFCLNSQNYHYIGLPVVKEQPIFAQLYIHNTKNEIANKIGLLEIKRRYLNLT